MPKFNRTSDSNTLRQQYPPENNEKTIVIKNGIVESRESRVESQRRRRRKEERAAERQSGRAAEQSGRL
jgi:hypothetical protein